MSKDALLVVTGAILTSIRDDRRDLWRHFVENEMALKAEALVALNAASVLTREDTHGALEGGMLDTVLCELRDMRRMIKQGYTRQLSIGGYIERLERLDAALLFLENPK